MTLITTIEIDEVETEVTVQFTVNNGEVEISNVTSADGLYIDEAVAHILLADECHEMASDMRYERSDY